MGAGAHIVASRALYGGSHNLLDYTLPRFGITTTFVDPRDLDAWRAAIRPETRLLFGETLGNPGPRRARHPARRGARARARRAAARRLDVHDALADAAVRARRRPRLPLGDQVPVGPRRASSAACSSTPGRSTGTAAAARGKFPTLTEPYDGFHDMVFAEESTTAAFLLRARREGMRDFGACMAPITAFQILQGVETLPLRMERHVANARKIVAFLPTHRVRRIGRATPSCPAIPITRSRSGCCRAGAAPCSASTSRARARRGAAHRGARPVLAPRQRRRREVAGDPSGVDDAFPDVGRRPRARPASPKARSGCRSGSRIPRT